MSVYRIDRGTLRPAKRLADGRLRVDAILTRSGVFDYVNPDGTIRREYRPDAEVFAPESLESFSLVPLTNDHPPVMITAENAREYACGSVGENIRRDGDQMIATLMVTDATLIAAMEAGKRDVSNGYHCDLDETPGVTPNGERYDAVQRNIRGNHAAIVERGRAGVARVRLDATTMLDNSHMDLAQAIEKAAAEKARADIADALLKAAQDEIARANGERDAAKADADAARADAAKVRADADASLAARVRERVALESSAAKVLGDADRSALTDREIKAAVIAKVDSFTVDASHCDVYVSARFDSAVTRAAAPAPEAAVVRVDTTGGGNTEAARRKAMETANANAWKDR